MDPPTQPSPRCRGERSHHCSRGGSGGSAPGVRPRSHVRSCRHVWIGRGRGPPASPLRGGGSQHGPRGGPGGSAPRIRRAGGAGTSRTTESRAPPPSTKLVFLLQGSRGSGSWPSALTSSNGCDRTYSSRPRAGRGGRRRRGSSRPGPPVEFGRLRRELTGSKPACPTSPSCREHVGAAKASEPHGGVAVLRPRRRRPSPPSLPATSRVAFNPPSRARPPPTPDPAEPPRGFRGPRPRCQAAVPTSISFCSHVWIGRARGPPTQPPPLRGGGATTEPPLGVRGQRPRIRRAGVRGPRAPQISRSTLRPSSCLFFRDREDRARGRQHSPPATVATEPTPAVRERGGGVVTAA